MDLYQHCGVHSLRHTTSIETRCWCLFVSLSTSARRTKCKLFNVFCNLHLIRLSFRYSTISRLLFPQSIELPPQVDGWFGKHKLTKNEDPPNDDISVNKFVIDIPDSDLEYLQNKLEQSRFFDSIENTQFRYGFNSNTLKDVVQYWKATYNWRKWESELNKYDQFKTQIEGLDIHFVHVRPLDPNGVVLPLLVVHGWPGSFFEYYKAIPHLIDSSKSGLSFEVIAPSIPGYGFSEAPHKEGFNVVAAARIFVKLMNRLGHKKFFIHGGDWGSFICKTISVMYPESVRGMHITLCSRAQPQGSDIIRYWAAKYLPMVMFYNQETQKIMFNEMEQQVQQNRWHLESGYRHIQETKPDTIGAALTDSPIGLLAYILEKFSTWTNLGNIYKPDGNLTKKFSIDELLTNVMIYWISGNITSSMRFYRENLCPGSGIMLKYNISAAKVSESVPVGYAVFPNEILRLPEFVAKMTFPNLIHYSEIPSGGHFGAFEEPELMAEDLKRFAYSVVSKI